MARCAVHLLPMPDSATTWEQTWSTLRQLVGKLDQAVEQLVCRIFDRLMVRSRSIDNPALMGDFADQIPSLLRRQHGSDFIDRHPTTYGQRHDKGGLQRR